MGTSYFKMQHFYYYVLYYFSGKNKSSMCGTPVFQISKGTANSDLFKYFVVKL